MSELPGTSAVGIESVEWADGGGRTLTVLVTGRWRRRRPWSAGAPVLVVEAEGRRQRFAALPEPPSLESAAPGRWRLTFSVPGELAPELGGHAWLAFGSVTVPLAVPEPGRGDEGDGEASVSPVSPVSPVGSVGPVSPDPEPTADEAEPEPEPTADGPGPAADDPEHDRVRVERAVRDRRRHPPRVPAEPPAAAAPPVAAASPVTAAPHAPAAPVRPVPSAGATPPAPPPGGVPGESELVAALRHELDVRARAQAGLRARCVQAETMLATRVLVEQRTSATLRELRGELDALRGMLDGERERRRAAEADAERLRRELTGQRERSSDAYRAIGELRGALDTLRPADGEPEGEGDPPSAGGTVAPERLSDALARLRETSAPREPALEQPPGERAAPGTAPVGPAPSALLGRATVDVAFRRLAARDAPLAGRLLLDLLGAQHAAWPAPVAYDIVLGPGQGCVQVTAGAAATGIELRAAPRARDQVDFQLSGDPGRVARLLTAGALRRRLRIGLARVRGRRDRLDALRALLALPLDLGALRAAGMRDEPETLLALVAAMIDPAWTRGERFVLAHRDERGRTVHLEIRDGRPVAVTHAAPGAHVAVTMSGSTDRLAHALGPQSGAQAPAGVDGDAAALALVRGWIDRARGL